MKGSNNMERFTVLLGSTGIYLIALSIITILNIFERKNMKKLYEIKIACAYMKGKNEVLREYRDKMQAIDRLYEQLKKDNNIIDIEAK